MIEIKRYFSHYMKSELDYYYRINLMKNSQYNVYNDIGRWYSFFVQDDFNTLEEAQNALDNYLLDGGYILLTEKQYEKYRVLL
jgi:hypothetical protein